MLQLAVQPLSCCLLWTNLLGVTLLEPPCSPGCVQDTGSVCQVAPRHSHRFSVPAPSPLCAQKLSGGDLHSQQEQGRGAVNILKSVLSWCFTFWWFLSFTTSGVQRLWRKGTACLFQHIPVWNIQLPLYFSRASLGWILRMQFSWCCLS